MVLGGCCFNSEMHCGRFEFEAQAVNAWLKGYCPQAMRSTLLLMSLRREHQLSQVSDAVSKHESATQSTCLASKSGGRAEQPIRVTIWRPTIYGKL